MNYRKTTTFKNGDIVVKYKAYSAKIYCAHGGDSHDVPIGTTGKITLDDSQGDLCVFFDNHYEWSVDSTELMLEEEYLAMKSGLVTAQVTTEELSLGYKEEE